MQYRYLHIELHAPGRHLIPNLFLATFVERLVAIECKHGLCGKEGRPISPYVSESSKFKVGDKIVVLLKRFGMSGKRPFKINTHIELHARHHLPFCSTSGDDLEVVMARLDAVVCHVGSIDRGHYFTLVRNSLNNRWFLYDDDAIFEITEAFALSFHMEPYMLIYTREKP